MPVKNAWEIFKNTISEFFDNRVLKLSAALAYYTIFSLPGLLIIILWISEIFMGGYKVESTLYEQIEGFVGSDAARQIQETIVKASASGNSNFAATIGLITLLIGATSIFGEVQDSINMIWRLKAKPRKGRGWLKLVTDRLLSFSIIVSLGFLLLVSLVVNGVMDALIDRLTKNFPKTEVVLAYSVNVVLTFLIVSFLFGLIFKVLPDARIRWRHVRAGAFTTAILFMIGKFLISYYLGQNIMSSAYGAAGSVIVILLWVYYSAIILYVGAIFTRLYAIHKGTPIYPNQYAVWVEQVEVESEQASLQEHVEIQQVLEEAKPNIENTVDHVMTINPVNKEQADAGIDDKV